MDLPRLSARADLAARDGQRAQAAGVYAAERVPTRKPRPGERQQYADLGHVALVLADGSRVRLGRGPRPAGERAALAGLAVVAEGILALDPDAGSIAARPEPVPTLLDPAVWPDPAAQRERHESWLLAKVQEARSVQPGMTRADLLRLFEEDGGMQPIPPARYVLRSCKMIQVQVAFDGERIERISAPYLALQAMD